VACADVETTKAKATLINLIIPSSCVNPSRNDSVKAILPSFHAAVF
jgi:hypothetical protein